MSMAPDPKKILGLLRWLNEDFRARSASDSLDSLFRNAALRVLQIWPVIAQVRTYRVDAQGTHLVATAGDAAPETAGMPDIFAQAIAQQRVIYHAEQALWAAPLLSGTQVFGLLVVRFKEDVPEAEGWLQVLAAMLAPPSLQASLSDTAALNRQVSLLQTLNDLSSAISMARDEKYLFSEGAQAFVTAMDIDYCDVFLLDDTQQAARIVARYPAPASQTDDLGQHIPTSELPLAGLLGQQNPAPDVLDDPQNDSRLSEAGRAALRADQVQSLMFLPLLMRGRLVGGIRLDIRRENHAFDRDMFDAAGTILAQVVVGLQQIRLLAEARRRSEQLQYVNQFGQSLQATLDLTPILEAALAESHRVIPIEHLSIALYDSQENRLRVAAFYASGESYLTLTNGAVVPLEESPAGHVWQNQQILHIPDVMQETSLMMDHTHAQGTLLVLPLKGRSRALGTISVGHSQPNLYSDTDIIVFQQMVGLLATAIENATVYAGSQRMARNEALVNDIAIRLQQQVELDDMLHIAVNDLGRALGARRARIRLGMRVTE